MEGDSKSTHVPLLVKSELSKRGARGGKKIVNHEKLKSQHDNEQDNDESLWALALRMKKTKKRMMKKRRKIQ